MSILLLSGPIAVGKSALSKVLIESHNFQAIRTGLFLASLAKAQGIDTDRASLQNLGDTLDLESDFRWIVDASAERINADTNARHWLLDSVRKARQVEHFRNKFGSSVFHVHLTSEENILKKRYEQRLNAGDEYVGNTPYLIAIKHPNELSARSLYSLADFIIDTEQNDPENAAKLILQQWAGRNK